MNNYQGFRAASSAARHIVVLAGAGLSAGSNIPTFRGIGGFWRRYDAALLATPEAFEEDPSLVWQFYHYRRETVFKAQPNRGHRALAMLCAAPSTFGPHGQSFHLVTQNVDGLSSRVLPESAPPSARPIEMHGNLCSVRCTVCGTTVENTDSPICPALGGTEQFFSAEDVDAAPKIAVEDLPRCQEDGCGGLLRPDVVWFGEDVRHLEEISELISKTCDIFCVVGTSSLVQPASVFAEVAREKGAKVAVFNIERTRADSKADFVFIGPCEETLVKAFGLEEVL